MSASVTISYQATAEDRTYFVCVPLDELPFPHAVAKATAEARKTLLELLAKDLAYEATHAEHIPATKGTSE